ncbi:hypothetical protein RDI58_015199 [Solanum bulbocastanum]|uniref:Uncharacterized protein n=1 Tax=Solanum bulbocastanum TaxID=147425 RepID=A0AAN8TEX1_SOLBU
MSSLLLWI